MKIQKRGHPIDVEECHRDGYDMIAERQTFDRCRTMVKNICDSMGTHDKMKHSILTNTLLKRTIETMILSRKCATTIADTVPKDLYTHIITNRIS